MSLPDALTPTCGWGDAPAVDATTIELVSVAGVRASVPVRMRNR